VAQLLSYWDRKTIFYKILTKVILSSFVVVVVVVVVMHLEDANVLERLFEHNGQVYGHLLQVN
jgi:hypothetical protein